MSKLEVDTTDVMETPEGEFFESLNRNNKSIKGDRALQIAEAAQTIYKREVEDLQMERKQLVRERTGMLDLSPTDANSLVLASDFDAKEFVRKDIEIGIKLRELQIKLEIATESYNKLFVGEEE